MHQVLQRSEAQYLVTRMWQSAVEGVETVWTVLAVTVWESISKLMRPDWTEKKPGANSLSFHTHCWLLQSLLTLQWVWIFSYFLRCTAEWIGAPSQRSAHHSANLTPHCLGSITSLRDRTLPFPSTQVLKNRKQNGESAVNLQEALWRWALTWSVDSVWTCRWKSQSKKVNSLRPVVRMLMNDLWIWDLSEFPVQFEV